MDFKNVEITNYCLIKWRLNGLVIMRRVWGYLICISLSKLEIWYIE